MTKSLQNAFPTHIWIWYDLEALQGNDEITRMHFVDVLVEIRFGSPKNPYNILYHPITMQVPSLSIYHSISFYHHLSKNWNELETKLPKNIQKLNFQFIPAQSRAITQDGVRMQKTCAPFIPLPVSIEPMRINDTQ